MLAQRDLRARSIAFVVDLVDGRVMRMFVLGAVLASGCGSKSAEPPGAALRLLPTKPDLVVRLDLARLRSWSGFPTLAPLALKNVQSTLDIVKRHCDLDVIAEASSLVIAKRAALIDGDLTLIANGLAKAKVTSCLQTLASSDAKGVLSIDGDRFFIALAGKLLASGAVLPTGEVVFVTRGGKGVDAAAWTQEVTAGGSAPIWWAELDAAAPIAARVIGEAKTAVVDIKLDDPLVAHGKVVTESPAAAANDLKLYQAVFEYLREADAGTGRLELVGATIHGDFTVTTAQLEHLLTIALPALIGEATPEKVATTSATPHTCAELAPAVELYLNTMLEKSADKTKAEMTKVLPTLVPKLQKAFVDQCTADGWSATQIDCPISNATALARFEKCRNDLNPDQRAHLDKAMSAAMAAP